ncbi:MAG: hypothetical protein ACSNEK_00815 [Parachlamydiaceae bacterium]
MFAFLTGLSSFSLSNLYDRGQGKRKQEYPSPIILRLGLPMT